MATAQLSSSAGQRTHLTLKGSTTIVHEFFAFSLQSILYQRGIYPSEDFKMVKKYGLQLLAAADEALAEYIAASMDGVAEALKQGSLRRLVIAVIDKETGETRERWQFSVEITGPPVEEGKENQAPAKDAPAEHKMTDAQVKTKIAAIMKQITTTNTFLPLLDDPCTFEILAYTDANAAMPSTLWSEADSARLIAPEQTEQVRLRSFSTAMHRVEAMVAYRRGDDDDP
ncbi:hypothetical protein A4X06_0g4035 [Tilletia controversa]|uniref:HORMA domain-containing protein n=1 Tax=Tilletia controversa TaxID=13291 RepID=A0A8X7MUH5_9BASI|nr:hypothetical protein A4X06_0g4035 [Tilletia controversa]